jgi:dTDP-glucose 4,6-dehydratase
MTRVVVTGGAGFVGSHLCRTLVARGDDVLCVDNLSTGAALNVADLDGHPRFRFQREDVSESLTVDGHVDAIAHLACPASPPDYLRIPLETMAVGSRGTDLAVRLADEQDARLLLASTSEVYGDPLVHPQVETYWGNVNPIGPRSVYDESKRFAEALVVGYRRARGTNTGIVRIFNTYGPGMRPNDGRVVSNFVVQALGGRPLTVYGDGSQTRSICYVDDLVRGLIAMLDVDISGPVNLGNPAELTVLELAQLVLRLTGSASPIEHLPLPVDDPTRRRPDITLASQMLGWAPKVTPEEGLLATIEWFGGRRVESG